MEFVFSEGSKTSTRRVDGLAFVNEDVVGECVPPGTAWLETHKGCNRKSSEGPAQA